MHYDNLERLFSTKRLETYNIQFQGDKAKAVQYYQLNTKLSESFYPFLANLEIALRNSIHQSFSKRFKNENWFEMIENNELINQINNAKSKIRKNRQEITSDKIVAELTFGFWTSLFNKQYAKEYWKPLMHVFKELNVKEIQRDKIAYKLNQVRKFRNRIFHYEPICNDLKALKTNISNIFDILSWLDKELLEWSMTSEKLETYYKEAAELKST